LDEKLKNAGLQVSESSECFHKEREAVLSSAKENKQKLDRAPRVQRGDPMDKLPVANIIKRDAAALSASLTEPLLGNAMGDLLDLLVAEWDEWTALVKNRSDKDTTGARTDLNYSASFYKLTAIAYALGRIEGVAVAACAK